MWKKLLCLVMSVVTIALSCGTVAYAQGSITENFNSEIQPCYEFTSDNKENLLISSDKAVCESKLTGYSGTTTKITIKMSLEKKVLWWWSEQTSWTATFNSYRGSLSKSYGVGGGTYRVKAVYTVYSGTQSETITGYSQEVKN